MRRAAFSIPANIVEGFRRPSKKEKSHFFGISQASADELLYFLILSHDLGYLQDITEESKMIDGIVRMLAAMIKGNKQ